jgi:hypothetical protein
MPSHTARHTRFFPKFAFWESIKNSKNPAMFKAYLKKYPEGSFASLATIMLDESSSGTS